MTSKYIPYVSYTNKENQKISLLLRNNIDINGLVIDYRRIGDPRVRRSSLDIICNVYAHNNNATIIIDPRTDAFQSNKNIRSMYKTLRYIYNLADYDNVISDDRYFQPHEIEKKIDRIIDKLYESVNFVVRTLENNSTCRLNLFVPPYFVANQYNDIWYKITLKSIKTTIDKKSHINMDILAPIALSKEFFNNSYNIEGVVNDYKDLDVNGYYIIPFNINELTTNETVLRNIAILSLGLKKNTGKSVIVYAGEFGNILISLGIDGTTCGMCNKRNQYTFELFENGIAEISRIENHIYVPKIFRKLYSTKFLKLIELLPDAFSCDCPICREYGNYYYDLIENTSYAELAAHYVYWKNIEHRIYSGNVDRLTRDLKMALEIINEYNIKVANEYFFIEDNRYRYTIDPGYIKRWLSILTTLSHNDSANL